MSCWIPGEGWEELLYLEDILPYPLPWQEEYLWGGVSRNNCLQVEWAHWFSLWLALYTSNVICDYKHTSMFWTTFFNEGTYLFSRPLANHLLVTKLYQISPHCLICMNIRFMISTKQFYKNKVEERKRIHLYLFSYACSIYVLTYNIIVNMNVHTHIHAYAYFTDFLIMRLIINPIICP